MIAVIALRFTFQLVFALSNFGKILKTRMMIPLSKNSITVLERRYLRRNAGGTLHETPEGLFHRVARVVASAELTWGKTADATCWEQKFFQVMSELLFLPNSPTLMNAGTINNQLSACFVLPVPDNMNGIFTTLKQAALIQQSGGGTGFNFSHLRPRGDIVSATGGTASGPVSFMMIYDAATEHVKQGGKRRGANMGILNVDHPDILEFIAAKKQKGVLSNFNISVGLTNDFMHALEDNGEWPLVHPNSGLVTGKLMARELWDSIVENAWDHGDPGLIFLDAINASNPTPGLGAIEATNPCGEVPLLSYEACNLGSVNLSAFTKRVGGRNEIDWEKLEDVVITAIRFLDDVIEVNNYIIPETKQLARGNRKTGLGVMGWAELLILLEIPYESAKALQLAEQLMGFIQEKAKQASASLAVIRGVFPNWEKSIYYPHSPMRNATRTSIAPTGTISIIADTSSSIEPLFALAFSRQEVLDGEVLISVNKFFRQHLERLGLPAEEILARVMEDGVAGHIAQLPAASKELFKTAMEISPFWHLQHQAAFQKYTDNAVSKTINLPEHAGRKDVDEIYRTAWSQQLKGITLFRYRSRDKQVMHKGIRSKTEGCKVCVE